MITHLLLEFDRTYVYYRIAIHCTMLFGFYEYYYYYYPKKNHTHKQNNTFPNTRVEEEYTNTLLRYLLLSFRLVQQTTERKRGRVQFFFLSFGLGIEIEFFYAADNHFVFLVAVVVVLLLLLSSPGNSAVTAVMKGRFRERR